MLRTSLVGITRTIPAKMRESGGVFPATMYPAYVKADSSEQATSDYEELENLPSVNGVVLKGGLSLADLGIVEAQDSDIEELFNQN